MNYANGLDLNGDGKYDATDEQIGRLQARQLYARHLYVLMMLVMDRSYVVPTTGLGAVGSSFSDTFAPLAVHVYVAPLADS